MFNRIFRKCRVLMFGEPKRYGWFGDYPSWQEASIHCGGYNQENILHKVRNSVLKVKNGMASYERDSVAFETYQCDDAVKTVLQEVSDSVSGTLNIVDFGGSLGSLYYQYRRFLNHRSFSWDVIEQKHFVDCGRIDFADGVLDFNYTMEESISKRQPHLLVLSSVLAYLEDPYLWIEKFCGYRIPFLMIDRTAFIEDGRDRITIQIVPPDIYEASYPSWFFNEQKLIEKLELHYELIRELPDTVDGEDMVDGKRCYRKGFFFKLKS